MLKFYNRLSIQIKFLIGSLSTLLSLALFIIIFYPQKQQKEQIVLLKDKVKGISDILAFGIGAALESGDFAGIKNAFDFAKQYKELNYIVIIDTTGEKLTEHNPRKIKTDSVVLLKNNTIHEKNGEIKALASIVYIGKNYGSIMIGYSTEKTYQNIANNRLTTIYVTMFILIFGVLFSLLISRSISKQQKDLETSNKKLVEDQEQIRQLNGELAIAKTEADLANTSKTQFLSNMSHEIRSPLNAISGFSQILTNKVKKMNMPHEFIQFLDNINLSSQNLSELINNILDLSKIEAGKMELSYEPLNLRQLFQGIYHINKTNAHKKGLNFSYSYDDNLPKAIETDRTKVNQILMNLASNAIKFTPKGKEVTLKAIRDQDFIVFQVIDQGIGISKDRLGTVFNSFEQADNTITRRFGGTGLGLSITKKMVEIMGGNISVESEEGKGSIFAVSIPLKETEEQVVVQQKEHLDNYHFSKDNIVLVVEDDELNQEVLKALFGELGLVVHVAGNGKTGIEKMIDLKPNLILMDMHMPVMDGLEATQKIRQMDSFADIPIVAISADAFIQQQRKALEAGVNQYMTKPIDLKKLMPLLSEYLVHANRSEAPEVIKKPAQEEVKLPDDVQAQLTEALSVLAKTPTFKLGEMLEQIKKIRKIVHSYDFPYTDVLTELEDAIFEDEVEQIESLLNKIVHE